MNLFDLVAESGTDVRPRPDTDRCRVQRRTIALVRYREEVIRRISSRSLSERVQEDAATLARTCSGRVDPAVTDVTGSWAQKPGKGEVEQFVTSVRGVLVDPAAEVVASQADGRGLEGSDPPSVHRSMLAMEGTGLTGSS